MSSQSTPTFRCLVIAFNNVSGCFLVTNLNNRDAQRILAVVRKNYMLRWNVTLTFILFLPSFNNVFKVKKVIQNTWSAQASGQAAELTHTGSTKQAKAVNLVRIAYSGNFV
jgi:hypothetical protein